MERRHHTSHDRAFWRTILPLALPIVLGAACFLIGSLGYDPRWLGAVAIVAGVAALGFMLVEARWINRCRCPLCGKLLRRPPDSREFVCADCAIIWWTHSWGSSFWDWFT